MPTRREFLSAMAALAASARTAYGREFQVRTVVGTGLPGYVPEGSSGADALSTPITNPYGVIVGADEALYFCEVDTGRTRRVDLATNRLTTIAGNGEKAYAGDGGPAHAASFSAPHEIRFDGSGNLYVVERDAHVVRRIDAGTGMVSTVAGTGVPGFSGDGGPADRAQLRQPHSIAFDATGDLLICDIGNSRIRAVDLRSGTIRTYAGTGDRSPTPTDAPLSGTPLQGPRSLDTDGSGNVYLVLREGNAVFRIERRAGRLVRIAGAGITGHAGDGGPAIEATFSGPKGIAYSAADRSLYIVDTENHAIRRIDLTTGIITTVLGTGQRGDGPDGDPLRCQLARPHGVFMHRDVLYVTDSENHRIRALQPLA
jgi:sugar lactone lactonase YvrE